jgi:hypothetical protein
MGFSPTEVDRMSVFQYMAALDGFAAANDPESAKRLSANEQDELWTWLQSKDDA